MYIMDLPDKLVACAAAIWPLFLEYETPLTEKDLDVVELTPTDGLLTNMASHGRLSTTSHGLYPTSLPTKNNKPHPTSWIDTKDDLIKLLKMAIRIRTGGVLWIVLQPTNICDPSLSHRKPSEERIAFYDMCSSVCIGYVCGLQYNPQHTSTANPDDQLEKIDDIVFGVDPRRREWYLLDVVLCGKL